MEKLKYLSPTLLLNPGGDIVIEDPPSQGDAPVNTDVSDTISGEMSEDN